MSATVFFSSTSEIATLSNTFKVAGVATDPGVATLTVTSPTLVVTAYTGGQLTHPSTGVFSRDVTCNEAGTWTFQWDGTTTASDTTVGTWDVQETSLGNLYATVEAIKSRLRITGTTDDYEIHTACFSASRAVEQECGRHFYRTANTEVRTFVPDGLYCTRLDSFCDLVTVAALKTDPGGDGVYETTWTTADYQLLPRNPQAAPERRPYTEVKAVGAQTFPLPAGYGRRDDLLQVTGVYGWPAVPRMIQQAALILAQDTFALKETKFGQAQFGDITVRAGTASAANRMIGPYRRDPVLIA